MKCIMTNRDDLITWINANSDNVMESFTMEKDKFGNRYTIKHVQDGTMFCSYYIDEVFQTQPRTILLPGVVEKTNLIQEVESKLADYIYEIDRDFIMDAGSSVYEIIYSRAYDIAESVLTKGLEDDYSLLERDEDDVVEEIISFIDFESLYEIIDEVLNAPRTMEEKLAEVGMSIYDFI